MEQGMFQFEERQIFRVSDLLGKLRAELESGFRNIWIQGEISNLKRPTSGHLYFSLKDDESQIAAVCFRMQSRLLRFEPEDGMDVLVRGSVTIYPARGQLQVMVEHMEPLGRGALQVAFEQLKKRLLQEGLFDEAHKQKLPLLPSKIGVVTSPTGAAIQDILRVLKRRNDRVSVLVHPARVQGKAAVGEIVAGIEYLNTRPDIDVIIVARGGGSLEDLWAFNEEAVARAVYQSGKPIISAIGHETDFTIIDFVADLRAATPSAAAEIVSGRREELELRVQHLVRRAFHAARFQLNLHRQKFERLVRSRGFVDAETRVRFLIQRLDELRSRLQGSLAPYLLELSRDLDRARTELGREVEGVLREKRSLLSNFVEKLKAFSPLQVLERGFAIVTNEQGNIVRDPQDVQPGESIHVRVARGPFRARKED